MQKQSINDGDYNRLLDLGSTIQYIYLGVPHHESVIEWWMKVLSVLRVVIIAHSRFQINLLPFRYWAIHTVRDLSSIFNISVTCCDLTNLL